MARKESDTAKVYRIRTPFSWKEEPYNDRSKVYAADHPAVALMGDCFEEIEVIGAPSQARPPTVIAEPEVIAEPDIVEAEASNVESATAAPGEKREVKIPDGA